MSGYIRQIQSSDGTPITAPSTVILGAASYVVFANDAAYEAVYGAGSEGDAYFNSTDQQVRVYKNAAWQYHKADESVYDNTGSGLTATDVQAAIDEVEGRVDTVETDKQDDVITTRGDTIIGNASGDASRLPIGSAGFVLTSDGTDPAWAPATGGSGGGTGKNYILNPDASVNATTGVTNTATTGSWIIDRTTTAAELPEETKGTAFKISGSSVTEGDTVEFAIEATGIDDADTIIGNAQVSVLDISGSINGEYKIQVYNVTTSAYVGTEETITGTGTYYLDVPLIATNDYEFHLKAAATGSPTNIGLSGITIEPVSQTTAGVIGDWESFTASFTNGPSITQNEARLRINGTNLEISYQGDPAGAGSASALYFNLPNGYTVDTSKLIGTRVTAIGSGSWFDSSASSPSRFKDFTPCWFSSDTTSQIRFYRTDGTSVENIQGSTLGASDQISFFFSIPVTQLANAYTLTATDMQYANASVTLSHNGGSLAATSVIVWDNVLDDSSQGQYDNSTGVWTCAAAGRYQVALTARSTDASSAALAIRHNGSEVSRAGFLAGGSDSSKTPIIRCEVGDTIDAYNPLGARTFIADSKYNQLTISRISDTSARSASLPFSDIADETQQYLLPAIIESGEGDLGTISGWASPGSKKYRWQRMGNKIDFWFYITSTGGSSSSSLTSFSFSLPGDVPNPENHLSNGAVNLQYMTPVTGATNSNNYLKQYVDYNSGSFDFSVAMTAGTALTYWVGHSSWMLTDKA